MLWSNIIYSVLFCFFFFFPVLASSNFLHYFFIKLHWYSLFACKLGSAVFVLYSVCCIVPYSILLQKIVHAFFQACLHFLSVNTWSLQSHILFFSLLFSSILFCSILFYSVLFYSAWHLKGDIMSPYFCDFLHTWSKDKQQSCPKYAKHDLSYFNSAQLILILHDYIPLPSTLTCTILFISLPLWHSEQTWLHRLYSINRLSAHSDFTGEAQGKDKRQAS